MDVSTERSHHDRTDIAFGLRGPRGLGGLGGSERHLLGSVSRTVVHQTVSPGARRETVMIMPITVYLLDDHEIVRRGLRELLEATGDISVIGESGLAREAARRIPALRPDVAIFDVRLPDGSGIDACRDVRSIDPTIKALVLTSFDDESALSMAVLAGAHGFVLKDIKGTGLVDAIRRIAAGERLLDEAAVARVKAQWGVAGGGRETDERLRLLSPQERRILDHIATGMTNRQIGEAMSIAEKTVKNYVTSVLAKLGMERRTQAAVFAATEAGRTQR